MEPETSQYITDPNNAPLRGNPCVINTNVYCLIPQKWVGTSFSSAERASVSIVGFQGVYRNERGIVNFYPLAAKHQRNQGLELKTQPITDHPTKISHIHQNLPSQTTKQIHPQTQKINHKNITPHHNKPRKKITPDLPTYQNFTLFTYQPNPPFPKQAPQTTTSNHKQRGGLYANS